MKITLGALCLASCLALSTAALVAQQADIHILPLRGNVYMLVGAGANITLSIGKEGVLLVDAGTVQAADKVIAAVAQLSKDTNGPSVAKPCAGLGCSGNEFASLLGTIASPAPPKPIQYIIDTSADADHTGGNAKIAAAGTTYGGGPGLGQFVGVVKESATIYAHENVLERMSAAKIATAALPTESYPSDFKQFFNGEGIHLLHVQNAHSDGDSIVHFRGSDVISAGDILSTVTYPMFDVAKGGSINGIIRGLNDLLDLAIAEYQTEGGTLIIPGHGRVCDSADLATYRDMVTILRDRVQDAIKRGLTLEQVKAARLTKDYDPRYDVPAWTKDQFVEAMYRSLSASPSGKK
ncbi:MAG TPA: MBL fold metallo-hydrolase [Vicinamibacterales bacterium]|nr:MBL fold metallo-hydrolase [Vicinamibacterales bacterium]